PERAAAARHQRVEVDVRLVPLGGQRLGPARRCKKKPGTRKRSPAETPYHSRMTRHGSEPTPCCNPTIGYLQSPHLGHAVARLAPTPQAFSWQACTGRRGLAQCGGAIA